RILPRPRPLQRNSISLRIFGHDRASQTLFAERAAGSPAPRLQAPGGNPPQHIEKSAEKQRLRKIVITRFRARRNPEGNRFHSNLPQKNPRPHPRLVKPPLTPNPEGPWATT